MIPLRLLFALSLSILCFSAIAEDRWAISRIEMCEQMKFMENIFFKGIIDHAEHRQMLVKQTLPLSRKQKDWDKRYQAIAEESDKTMANLRERIKALGALATVKATYCKK